MSETSASHLNQYSFQDSRFNIINDGASKFIRKETRLNDQLKPHWNKLYTEVLQYFHTLKAAQIPVPQIIETSGSANGLIFICEHQGNNILQTLDASHPEGLLEQSGILDQVLTILKQAQDNNLHFDPHIKNFVAQNNKVHYVDFTPPWTQTYFDLRLSLARQAEKDILVPFFGCMAPKILGYHFAADFLKMDSSYQKIMPPLFDKLQKKELVKGSFEQFMEVAADIMAKERRREKEQTYLL